MHPLPDTSFTLAYKPFVYAIPLAILGREQPPRCSGPGDRKDGIDKLLAFAFIADVQAWLTTKELEQLGLMFWR